VVDHGDLGGAIQQECDAGGGLDVGGVADPDHALCDPDVDGSQLYPGVSAKVSRSSIPE